MTEQAQSRRLRENKHIWATCPRVIRRWRPEPDKSWWQEKKKKSRSTTAIFRNMAGVLLIRSRKCRNKVSDSGGRKREFCRANTAAQTKCQRCHCFQLEPGTRGGGRGGTSRRKMFRNSWMWGTSSVFRAAVQAAGNGWFSAPQCSSGTATGQRAFTSKQRTSIINNTMLKERSRLIEINQRNINEIYFRSVCKRQITNRLCNEQR